MKNLIYFLLIFLTLSLVSASDNEEIRFICGGNSELKILCGGPVENLYEIPEQLIVSIIFPDDTDVNTEFITLHANMSRNLAICNYSLDGNVNISFGDANYNFYKSISVSNGYHFIDIWCRDTFNLKNTYYDMVSFYVYSITSPGGGGGEPSPIKLYRLKIFGESWVFNEKNTVNVFVYDIDDNLIDPDFLNISIISEVDLNSRLVVRSEKGKYKGVFDIKENNLSIISLNITVIEKTKVISHIFEIATEKISTLEEFKRFTMGKFEDLESFWNKYWIYIYLILVLILFCIIWLFRILWIRKKKKK